MHTTSLIGQALGGATGGKTSPAQDAPKKTSERSFADHVDGTSPKQEAAKPKTSQINDVNDGGKSDQVDAHDGAHDAVDADGTPANSEGVVADQRKGDSTENTPEDDAEPPGEEAIAAGNVVPDAEKRTVRSTDLPEGARMDQRSRSVPEQATGRDPAKGAETVAAEDGEAALPKAGLNSEAQTAGREKGQGSAAANAASAKGEAIETQAPARVAQSDGESTASAARGGDLPAIEKSTTPGAADAAGEESVRPARTQAGVADLAAARVVQGKPGGAATSASRETPSGAVNSATPASSAEVNASLKAEEKAADARIAAADKAAPVATAATNKTPVGDSLPKSVFQMQIESAEVGESRKARYRSRMGEAHVTAEVARESTAAAGVQTNANTAITATANSALEMANALQNDAMKLSQALGFLSDSSGGGLSMTADLPGLPQILTEAVFQPGITHRPETPRMIASQIAEAFVTKGDRNVDVSLNPEELGKVKMRVATSENGITMIIQTERPETGDLMRRHINELAEEFRRMGFQDISFEFSSGDSAGGQAQQGLGDGTGTGAGSGHGASTATTDMSATDEVAETQIQNLRLGSTGVDMRV